MARVRGLEVSGPDALFAARHVLGDDPVPGVVVDLAGAGPAGLVWGNELGGLTFRIGDRFVTWNPLRTGIDLDRERLRLEWLNGRHPAPRVLAWGQDAQAQWLVTTAVPGEHAVGATWQARCRAAITAIAAGLRALHAIATDDFPATWTTESWVGRAPASLGPRPHVHDPVLVHGDACAPNTLISAVGQWTGNVDFGDLAVGDRWADLAVASNEPGLELRPRTTARTVRRLRDRAGSGADPVLPRTLAPRILRPVESTRSARNPAVQTAPSMLKAFASESRTAEPAPRASSCGDRPTWGLRKRAPWVEAARPARRAIRRRVDTGTARSCQHPGSTPD